MRRFLVTLFLSLITSYIFSQNQLKPLTDLINKSGSTWRTLQSEFSKAKNHLQVLHENRISRDSTLYYSQVTTNSSLGSIIYFTGGILVDHGWLRILGSGSAELNRNIIEWNKNKSIHKLGEKPSYFLVADDILGGLFALNGGAFGKTTIGNIYYYPPDDLKWNDLEINYSQFLNFCFYGNLDEFYKGMRWPDWGNEIASFNGSDAFLISPFLWSEESKHNILNCTRKKVTIQELWDLNFKTH